MFLSSATAGHRLLSRQRFCALDGRGDLSLVGPASGLPSHQLSCFASSAICAAVPPANAQHPSHLHPFAAPSRASAAAGHRAFSVPGAAVQLGAAGHRSLSQDRLCSAPPHGGPVLRRCGSLVLPAALFSPLSRGRMSGLAPASAKFLVLAGCTAVRLACAKPRRSPFARSRLSIALHSQAPNPAVERTCAKSRAGRSLLR